MIRQISHKTADLTMSTNPSIFSNTVVHTTIDCTNRPRQQSSPNVTNTGGESILINTTDKQTVNDHDYCLIFWKMKVTCPKLILSVFNNNLNHRIFALPQTFRVFLTIYDGDLDITSGTSKHKQTHVVTEHMTHRFQKPVKSTFLSVMHKYLYGHTGKDLNFLNITSGNIFSGFLKPKTVAEKSYQKFIRKIDMMARLFRTHFRTARFIQKPVKSIDIKFNCNIMIKHTIKQPNNA